MNRIELELFGRQEQILSDWLTTDKNCMDIIHAGAGKSHMAAIALPIFASDAKYHKGKDIVFITGTSDMIKTNIWDNLKRTCIEIYGIDPKNINNSDFTIRFPDSIIRCKSAEIRDRIRGMNAGIILADEAALFSEEVLQELTNRLRPRVGSDDSAGRMIIISTPKGQGPLYNMFKQAQDNPRWIVRHYNYMEMQSGNLDFINEQKRVLSPLKFAQDYMVSWESVSDQLFYTFDKRLHTSLIEDDGFGDLYSFHDFNKRVATAVVARATDPYTGEGTIQVLKAYAIDNCGTEQMAETIRRDFPRRRIYSIIDMSGSHVNRDTTSPFGVTDRTLLEKYGFTIINSTKINPLISDTDNTSNAFIKQGRLTIDSRQINLIDAMTSYHFEDGTRKKLVKYTDKYAFIDGLGDCIRYGIHHLFPLMHEYQGMTIGGRHIPVGHQYLPKSELFPGGPTLNELLDGQEDQHSYRSWS